MSETSTTRFINPSELATPPASAYTHVVETRAARTIHISGQVALDQAGNIVGENDIHAQTIQVYENMKHALESVGATFNHVIKLNTFMTDITQIAAIRDVRRQYVNTAHPPASTTVEVSRLFRPGLLIEMDAVAVLDE
jgi:enamine deaminase RidA (YjgF/YER057c/UK114 family)